MNSYDFRDSQLHAADRVLASQSETSESETTEAIRTVVIVGAGPAGLAAARAARTRGANVTLLDASDYLGGQFWRHMPSSRPSAHERLLHHDWATYIALRSALENDSGCEIVTGAQVWALEAGGPAPVVHVLIGNADGAGREGQSITADSLVFATGAHDRTLPFPGWDLPGVFTGGAAQAFAKGERVAIGNRVVVAGAGPFLLPVAASLAQAGATVCGVYEASKLTRMMRGWLYRPWQLFGAAKKSGEAFGYLGNHLRNRIPYVTGTAVVEAHGTEKVEAVTVAKLDHNWRPIPGSEKTIKVDAVCVSHGFTPRIELPIAAGCAISPERFVVVDEHQLSTVPGVFAAGEITGIGGVDSALAEGTIAGHCAAGGLASDTELTKAVTARATFTAFASRIEAAHGIRPGWTKWLRDDTLICRCEEVSYSKVSDVAQLTTSPGLRSHKLSTRAGLGICQARVCGRTVEELLEASDPTPSTRPQSAGTPGSDRRPIVSPVRIGELAAATSIPQECPKKGQP